jgi:organic radical activating enzyme
MSDYSNAADNARKQLQTVSDTFCLAKWKQVSLHLPTGFNNSCYHPPLHKIPITEIEADPSALHNTSFKKLRRKEMLDGVRCEECKYCWDIEDTGNMSDRHYRSGEPWAMESFDQVVSADWDANVNPSYVEVNFSHGCNLACSYCSPQFSTTWKKEIDQYGAYPTTVPHNAPEYFNGDRRNIPVREYNPYVDAFWKWWPELYPELKHFRMTGGEPLMDKNTYRVFDWILDNPKPDLHLNVTSNFSVEPQLFEKYISYAKQLCSIDDIKLEHFMQFVSIDSWGSQAEYIRGGLDFDRLKNNVERFLDEVPYRSSITFIVTMNNLNVFGLPKLLEWIYELRGKYSKTYQRIWIDFPLLKFPAWQSLDYMPDSVAWYLQNTIDTVVKPRLEQGDEGHFQFFKDFELAKLQRDVDWMKSSVLSLNEVSQRKRDFYKFFSEYDKRRGYNFETMFPELQTFWEDCKKS